MPCCCVEATLSLKSLLLDMIGDVFAKFFGSVDLELEKIYATFLQEFPIAIDTFFKVQGSTHAFNCRQLTLLAGS